MKTTGEPRNPGGEGVPAGLWKEEAGPTSCEVAPVARSDEGAAGAGRRPAGVRR